MGTGTGFIALTLHIIKTIIPTFNPQIYASDILLEAIDLAKMNAERNNCLEQIEFIHSDLFHSFPESLQHSLDVIIFNPPYLPSIKNSIYKRTEDRSWDGGEQGFEVFIDFLNQIPDFLHSTESRIYYICSSGVKLTKLYSLIEQKGFKNTILERRHIFMEDIFLNRLQLKDD